MLLHVISTGSCGNAYLLKNGEASLLLDAGLPLLRIVRSIRTMNGLQGCLITHEHGDHVQAAKGLASWGIDVYATAGTLSASSIPLSTPRVNVVEYLKPIEVGAFTVLPIPVQHDAEQPCGYLIRANTTGETLLYATDTYYLRNTYPGVNFWLVECNYCDDIAKQQLDSGEIPEAMRNRLLGSHMSLRHLKETLAANDLTQTRKIILCHLSDGRSDEKRMVAEISAVAGKETIAASNGMIVDLSLTPF